MREQKSITTSMLTRKDLFEIIRQSKESYEIEGLSFIGGSPFFRLVDLLKSHNGLIVKD